MCVAEAAEPEGRFFNKESKTCHVVFLALGKFYSLFDRTELRTFVHVSCVIKAFSIYLFATSSLFKWLLFFESLFFMII